MYVYFQVKVNSLYVSEKFYVLLIGVLEYHKQNQAHLIICRLLKVKLFNSNKFYN